MAIRLRGHGKLTPEQALLLACARSTLQADHARRIRLAMQRGVDWDRLWSLAREHGVGFFVARHLLPPHSSLLSLGGREARDEGDSSSTRNGKLTPSIDPAFARQVKEDLWQETAHALILREHQLRLNAELTRCGMQVLWLKGLVLSERLYGRFEARHCGDLDLLAAPADVFRVEALLTQLGFERHRPAEPGKEFHPLSAHHSMWCARVLPDWLLIVELHHQLSGPLSCQPPVADLFRRSWLVDFHGQELRVPSIEDELLILCLHAHHHNYALLRCLMDVAEFVRRWHDQIDWAKLAHQARAGRCLGRLRAALEIADAALGLEPHADAWSRPPPLTSRQRLALRNLSLAALLDPRSQQDDLMQARFSLLMDSWIDSVRLLAPRLFPSRAYARSLCPSSWRRAPGLPHVYYYFHSADRMLKRGSSFAGS